MKVKILIAVLFLQGVGFAQAIFQHVVVVVQENRSPDNLFGACPPAGADVVPIGSPIGLAGTSDVPHSHAAFLKELAGKYPALAKNYVQASDIQPYCQLAAQYGFADRMFQTIQGPS